jgi:hypothetical protein
MARSERKLYTIMNNTWVIAEICSWRLVGTGRLRSGSSTLKKLRRFFGVSRGCNACNAPTAHGL